jgi:hypothetical protein
MPPDGYETVTLPTELVEDIDSIVGYDSRARAIRALLDSADMPHEHEWPTQGCGVDTDALVSDLVSQLPPKVAREVADELR